MSIKSYKTVLPVQIEQFHGLFAKRLAGSICDVGLLVVDTHRTLTLSRLDQADKNAENEEKSEGEMVLAALVALGLSLETLIDEAKLRAALRKIANLTDEHTRMQIAIALGRAISVPVPKRAIDDWIEAQVARILDIVHRWFSVVEQMLPGAVDPTKVGFTETIVALATQKSKAQRSAFQAAAAGLLLLNAELLAANAVQAGVQTYIWRTELDAVVRDHHADLEGTLQNFTNPPTGGGTGPDDVGNPGDGINCRCGAELVVVG